MQKSLFFLSAIIIALFSGFIQAAEPTVVKITDTPIRKDLKRIGLNLGGDSYYSGSILLKERIVNGGFEGIEYRTLRRMFGKNGDSFYASKKYYESWAPVLEGADYIIINGPDKGKKGKILKVSREKWNKKGHDRYQGKEVSRFKVSNPSQSPANKDFVIITDKTSDIGYIGQHGGPYWVFTAGNGQIVTEKGDNPPVSTGRHVAVFDAGNGRVELSAPCLDKKWVNPDGRWNLEFWAKGKGDLAVAFDGWALKKPRGGILRKEVPLSVKWKKHKITFDVKDYPNATFALHFELSSGKCKIDEISLIREGDKNQTPFRDPVIKTLKKFKPGSLRLLQMGGGSMDNFFRSSNSRMAYSAARNVNPITKNYWPGHPKANSRASIYSYGLNEFLQLCKEVKADPWICIPGLIYKKEMDDLMEYLSGPSNTKYGKLRADQGQKTPWTDVFANINIEFGNEAWNYSSAYKGRGFNGPEYWHDLIAAGKKSKYYNPKIKFQIAGQAVASSKNRDIAKDKTNADGFAVAPYVLHAMSKEQENMADEEIWSWVFGYPFYHAEKGYMAQNYKKVTEKYGMELSIYEVNHHLTGGDASEKARNRIVTSIGGALNIANWLMMMIEKQNVRVQNLFGFIQYRYRNHLKQSVKLWGTCLNMEEGKERYRPTFLVTMLLNKVLGGELVKIDTSGANPAWTCKANYERKKNPNKPFDVPYIHSYATKNGKTRGLILFNLHRTEALPVKIDFPGKVKPGNVKIWKLNADKIDADNEPEHEPQVKVTEKSLPTLKSGGKLNLKPFSLTVMKWDEL